MIKNEKQFTVTLSQREKLQEALRALSSSASDDPATTIRIDALQADINRLDQHLQDYKAAASGQFDRSSIQTVSEIGTGLVHARIAAQLTQKDLASHLGVKEQQIQRYESTEYMTANLKTLNKVSAILQRYL